jgi:hypothetical protein
MPVVSAGGIMPLANPTDITQGLVQFDLPAFVIGIAFLSILGLLLSKKRKPSERSIDAEAYESKSNDVSAFLTKAHKDVDTDGYTRLLALYSWIVRNHEPLVREEFVTLWLNKFSKHWHILFDRRLHIADSQNLVNISLHGVGGEDTPILPSCPEEMIDGIILALLHLRCRYENSEDSDKANEAHEFVLQFASRFGRTITDRDFARDVFVAGDYAWADRLFEYDFPKVRAYESFSHADWLTLAAEAKVPGLG